MNKIAWKLIICGALINLESSAEDVKFLSSAHTFSNFEECVEIIESKFSNLKNNFKNLEKKISNNQVYNTAQTLEKHKVELEDQITELKKIKTGIDDLELPKKIEELNQFLLKIKSISLNINPKENISKNQKSYFINQKSIEVFEKNLDGLNKALQNSRTRFNAILNKGSKIFDNAENKKLFNPNKERSPNLKKLFKRIYDARYPEALTAWEELKYTPSSEYKENLSKFTEKVDLLLQDVRNTKTYIKSLNNQNKKGYASNS